MNWGPKHKTKFPIEDWRSHGERFPELMLAEGVICKFSNGHANLKVRIKLDEKEAGKFT